MRQVKMETTEFGLGLGDSISLLQQITPLARQVNCLDIERIDEV